MLLDVAILIPITNKIKRYSMRWSLSNTIQTHQYQQNIVQSILLYASLATK